jgi:tRNA A-37 threonylcarbamoyl transferase component Bud32
MHASGFWHPDLHTANILVSANISPPTFWLVDLHAVGFSASISRRRRMADLAMMIFSLRRSLDESQMRTILAGYKPEADEAEITAMLARLSKSADAIYKRRVKSRAKRCLKTSGSFAVERQGNVKLYRGREFDSATILGLVRRHKEIKAQKASALVKSKSNGALTVFPLADAIDQKFYVKEFANRGFIRLLETLFYVHRGRRAWKAGHLLRILGVPCAEPVALAEARRCGLPHTSYLIMKEISHARRLSVFLLNRYFRVAEPLTKDEILEKRKFIREGVDALRDFHLKNIYHKDLSAKNLLVDPACNGKLRFYCVDTDSIQFPRRLSLRRRIKNLAQLNGVPSCIKSTDRMRFYMRYFDLQTLTRKHKAFIRVISWLSRRRMEHSRRIESHIKKNFPLEEEAYEDITSV